jgi:lipoprotein-anchoring transpeptidase ErfK/SrfK
MAVQRTKRTARVASGVLVLVLALTSGCGGGGDDDSATPRTTPATRGSTTTPTSEAEVDTSTDSLVASAKGPEVVVYDDEALTVEKTRLANPIESGAPLVFLVDQQRDDVLQVLLPIRPNGSTGWVRAADVDVARNPYHVTVTLSSFELTLRKDGEVVEQYPVGLGKADVPTPGGRFYIKELLQPPNPNGAYGPYAYGLSGFSNVLESFNGGEGVIGIHGTNDPSSIGQQSSHGCIRMNNDDVTALVQILPLGTPVEIVA